MKGSNRLLLVFGIAIAALVLVAVGLVLALGQNASPLLPEDTPDGTVQRYLLAVKEQDYDTARSYLLIPEETGTPVPGKPPYYPYPYPQPYPPYPNNPNSWKATLGKTSITGANATVEVIIDVFRGPSGPFDNPVRTNNVIFSLKNQDGRWLITSPLDIYWLY